VVGEVNRPGSYVVVGGATATATEQGGGGAGGLPTVTRAIQLAGITTSECSQYQIRRLTSGVGQNVDVNLWKLLRG